GRDSAAASGASASPSEGAPMGVPGAGWSSVPPGVALVTLSLPGMASAVGPSCSSEPWSAEATGLLLPCARSGVGAAAAPVSSPFDDGLLLVDAPPPSSSSGPRLADELIGVDASVALLANDGGSDEHAACVERTPARASVSAVLRWPGVVNMGLPSGLSAHSR